MGEAMGSMFEFDGDREEAERQLIALGYQKLEGSYELSEVRIEIRSKIAGRSLKIYCTCDEPELRRAVVDGLRLPRKGGMFFANLAEVRAWIESMAPGVVFECEESEYSVSGSLMSRELAASLPPYPGDRRDEDDEDLDEEEGDSED
jgi:hypothetical protein